MIRSFGVMALYAALLFCQTGYSQQTASDFDLAEIQVEQSPAQTASWVIPEGIQILDFDVSPFGPEVAALTQSADKKYSISFWKIGSAQPHVSWNLPERFQAKSLVWHPAKRRIFLSGIQDGEYRLQRVDILGSEFKAKIIYGSKNEIRRVLLGPRPFRNYLADQPVVAYRLFFGERTANNSFAILSITEDGNNRYQVVGPKSGITPPNEDNAVSPSEIVSDWALPASFHPAGNLLIWEDKGHKFHKAPYFLNWGKSSPLPANRFLNGSLTVTPNGTALIHWRPGVPGIELHFYKGAVQKAEASEYTFLSTPSSVPDGKGIVGLIKAADETELVFVPIQVPLADVVNAWMFLETSADESLFAQHGGLFRDLKDDQLYSLYESEAYQCNGYDPKTATRPYLVTTDIFWELFASAYEGMFIINERYESIPAFWRFVQAAQKSLQITNPQGLWAKVFSILSNIHDGSGRQNPEMSLIISAEGAQASPILKEPFNYGDLKPRGHYTAEVEMIRYFKAVRYLTNVSNQIKEIQDLRRLPIDVSAKALEWIRTYESFIAPARGPVIWQKDKFTLPSYARHPLDQPRAFPLSWGFDNEVLLSTVFHADWPVNERIEGLYGARLMPSGLDLADALGSRLARTLLQSEIEKYPRLKEALDNLQARYKPNSESGGANLYQRWIDALGKQWAEDVVDQVNKKDNLWRAKRLQTGLASWTNLRHATVLVNETTSAECGEGGFEEILMRPPRGAAEPDPAAFAAIAGLFESAAQMVKVRSGMAQGTMPDDINAKEPLRQGIYKRLMETAAKARIFEKIAGKELKGIPLSNQEYEEILYIGRTAEHNFIVFKSLANKDLALSTPDPMPKVVDISGGSGVSQYLMAAVGRPMEWNWIVPYFGRREIVKGAVYSYYEFLSDAPLTDAEWNQRLSVDEKNQNPSPPSHPGWISPFLSRINLSCPARVPF